MTATKKSSADEEAKSTSRSNRDVSERKHGCDVCKRRFFTRKDVKRHQVVHTGSRQFICCLCRHAFGRKDHLVRHEKKVHSQLNKRVLTPMLINDQLSFGIIIPVTRDTTSALNPNQQLPGNSLTPHQQTNLLSVTTAPLDTKLTDSEPPSPSLDFESLTLTLADWVHVDTGFSIVDMMGLKGEKSTDGNVTRTLEEAISTLSPGGYDSSISDSPGSSSGSSYLGDPNDLLNGIDLVKDLDFHDIDLETMTELYPLETEDYFTCI